MDILNSIFENVLFTTFASTIVALIVLLIRYFFRKKINIKINQVLISIVILRFCMIIVPESSISIFNLLPQFNVKNTISESLSTIHQSTELQQTQSYSIEKNTQNNYNKDFDERLYRDKDHSNTTEFEFSITDVVSIIWLSGFLLILIGACIIQKNFNNRLKLCRKINDNNVMSIVNKCKRILKLNSNVNIYMEDRFKSPFIIGFFEPRIYIPEQLVKLESKDLEHIIMHELAHFKRKDSIYNVLSIIATAINWFNPLIWKMTNIIRSDIELACDAYVLDKLGEDKVIPYGRSMLEVARIIIKENKQIGLACYFGNSKKQLERRIKMIGKFKKNTYKFTVATLSTALLVGGIVLTNPIGARAENSYQNNSMKVIEENINTNIIDSLGLDSNCRRYDNINRLVDDVDFKFMLPDYMPNNAYHVVGRSWYREDNRVKIAYSNKIKGEGYFFELVISPLDREKDLCKNEVKVDRISKNIEGVQGEVLTTKRGTYSTKYFVYNKDNMFYSIDYQRLDEKNNVIGELPESEVAKIIKSLKDPKDVNKNSLDDPDGLFIVYDMEDLKAAREMIGFDFKVPMNNSWGKCIESVSDKKSDISFSFKNFMFRQSNEIPFGYDQYTKKGNVQLTDLDKAWFDKVEGTWENINNMKVLKLVSTFTLLEDQKEPDKNVDYIWLDNGIYYTVGSYYKDTIKDIASVMKYVTNLKSYDQILK